MIDYCTIIVDKRECDLLPLHLNSLKRFMPGNWFNFKISVPPDDQIIEYCKQFPVDVLPQPTYVQANPSQGVRQAGFDCASRLDQLMRESTSKWVVLAHLDIVYTGPMMQIMRTLMTDEVGMIGIWPHGCVLINREVYNNCHYGFWPITGLRALKLDDDYVRLYGPFVGEHKLFGVVGVDVGDLLKMEMHCYGYKCVMGPEGFYHHIGGQSYRSIYGRPEEHAAEQKVEEDKQRAMKIFAEFKW